MGILQLLILPAVDTVLSLEVGVEVLLAIAMLLLPLGKLGQLEEVPYSGLVVVLVVGQVIILLLIVVVLAVHGANTVLVGVVLLAVLLLVMETPVDMDVAMGVEEVEDNLAAPQD